MGNMRGSYVVEKTPTPNAGLKWRLMHFPSMRQTGTVLSHYATRKAAMGAARFLAGWRTDVILNPSPKG